MRDKVVLYRLLRAYRNGAIMSFGKIAMNAAFGYGCLLAPRWGLGAKR